MDRVALGAYLEREFAEIIAEAALDIEPILDSVESVYSRVPDLLTFWDEPLADYFLLRRAKRAFMTMFDVGVEGDTYRLNQLYTNIAAALPVAEKAVSWLVIPTTPDTSNTGQMVTIATPWLETRPADGDGWPAWS